MLPDGPTTPLQRDTTPAHGNATLSPGSAVPSHDPAAPSFDSAMLSHGDAMAPWRHAECIDYDSLAKQTAINTQSSGLLVRLKAPWCPRSTGSGPGRRKPDPGAVEAVLSSQGKALSPQWSRSLSAGDPQSRDALMETRRPRRISRGSLFGNRLAAHSTASANGGVSAMADPS